MLQFSCSNEKKNKVFFSLPLNSPFHLHYFSRERKWLYHEATRCSPICLCSSSSSSFTPSQYGVLMFCLIEVRYLVLEICLSTYEYSLLLYETRLWFSEPIRWFTNTWNSISRRSDALFWPPWAPDLHVVHTLAKHSYTWKENIRYLLMSHLPGFSLYPNFSSLSFSLLFKHVRLNPVLL